MDLITHDDAPAPSAVDTPAFTAVLAPPERDDIRGWLLLLCISLIIITPGTALLSVAVTFLYRGAAHAAIPGLLITDTIESAIQVGLAGASAYAGYGLFTRRPGAVRFAKRFLVVMLFFPAVGMFLPLLLGLSPSGARAVLVGVIKAAIQNLAYFAIWFSYLCRSERVRVTFRTVHGV